MRTMAAESAERRWTAAAVRALPSNGEIHELVGGELLVRSAPNWAHQRAALYLYRQLFHYLRAENAGDVLVAPADISPDEHTLVQPDVFVVALMDGKPPDRWSADSRLLLAVEVLSPASRKHDRLVKRPLYQSMGADYWIVDLEAQVLECWGPRDERVKVLSEGVRWRADGSERWLNVELAALFSEVRGG
jgi:Uma2 family endonuclease